MSFCAPPRAKSLSGRSLWFPKSPPSKKILDPPMMSLASYHVASRRACRLWSTKPPPENTVVLRQLNAHHKTWSGGVSWLENSAGIALYEYVGDVVGSTRQ